MKILNVPISFAARLLGIDNDNSLKLFRIVAAFAVFIAIGWLFYAFAGHAIIWYLHDTRAIEMFNVIMPGQRFQPLEVYYAIFDNMFYGLWVALGLFGLMLWCVIRPGSTVDPALLSDTTEETSPAIDSIPASQIGIAIVIAAGTGLFLELSVIRLHSCFFQLFAYFKNVSLLSCFLGLGIGYLRAERRPALAATLPLLSIEVIFMEIVRDHTSGLGTLFRDPISENLSFGLPTATGITQSAVSYIFILAIFAFNALAFVPLGQVAGRLMQRQANLSAYASNLVGSLAGILLFTAFSFLRMPPQIWLLAGGAGVLLFLRGSAKALALNLAALCAACMILSYPVSPKNYDVYSPYQILTLELSRSAAPVVKASNAYFQKILNLSMADESTDPQLKISAAYYALPYAFSENPREILIVGSGTGNDVSAALLHSQAHIDAVEIDPAVLSFGQALHPMSPYSNPRVSAHVTDARGFISASRNKYDLVVYGLLDSHSMLSARAGGIRLDSYVYTVEAFRQARALLNPNGAITVSFSFVNPRMGRKLYLMLQEAFDGRPPRALKTVYDAGFTFVAGGRPDTPLPPGMQDVTSIFSDTSLHADPSTDDWPFFYMPQRTYPISYMVMIVLMLVISGWYIAATSPSSGRGGLSASCFFLGVGFMLLETKAITELSLVYSSTWVTVSVASASILLMACLANYYIMKKGAPPKSLAYALLLVSLLAGLVVGRWFRPSDIMSARLVMTIVLTLPLFCSGLVFSSEFEQAPSPAKALASNLAGAMLGGFLEYNSMYFGFASLYYTAAAMYLLAWFFSSEWGGMRKPVLADESLAR